MTQTATAMTEVQKDHLEFWAKHGSFNDLDAAKVVKSLMGKTSLWKAAFATCSRQLLNLRDINTCEYGFHADTLYLLIDDANRTAVLRLAKSWKADEVDVLANETARIQLGTSHPDGTVVRVWWD